MTDERGDAAHSETDTTPAELSLDDPALAAFDIERELGGGGMSRLFVALDRKFGRRVVIKVLVPSDVRSLSVDRFRREIAVATSLQHPNIVPILSAGEMGGSHGVPFLVMPFVEGESLRDRLRRGPLSIREAVGIARDVTRALVFAHERGIVHRDIKPGNVLLASGAAVVSDFGVAKALTSSRERAGSARNTVIRRAANHSLTEIGTSLGTPAYMAPEQAAADPNVDHRADLYALGVVLYEMLTGTPPFHGRSPQELLRAQLADPPPPLASRRHDVPLRLDELVERCLEKEPFKRPRNATEVLRWLEDPAVVSGVFATDARRRKSRGARARLVGAAAVGLLLVAAVATQLSGLWSADADSTEQANATPGWSRRVVIGPIVALTPDAESQRFIAGVTSDMAAALTVVPGLQLNGASAALTAQDSAVGAVPALPGVLRIEGTVQREHRQIRLVLRAVDLSRDSTVWSNGFTGPADSLLAFQERIARAVSGALTSVSLTMNAR